MLARSSVQGTRELDAHEYYSAGRFRRSVGADLTLVIVHMASLVNKDRPHIDKELIALAAAVREVGDAVHHGRTILMGDLNANPSSEGVVDAIGPHGVMSRAVAAREARRASPRTCPFFFNPMWQFFCDAVSRPAGTCYYEPEGHHTGYCWNAFDQVLIRPSLLPYYDGDSVRIVGSIAGTKLTLPSWTPGRSVGSDHLPVRVRLNC
jgi:endonuclease/exonuclease/phosphatase family metal-dependent hydrolase